MAHRHERALRAGRAGEVGAEVRRTGTWIALRLHGLGSDAGGMVIEVAGVDQRLDAKTARWSLRAQHGDGPYVPVLAAAAVVWGLAMGQAILRAPRPVSSA